jgi:hypothetical protein
MPKRGIARATRNVHLVLVVRHWAIIARTDD